MPFLINILVGAGGLIIGALSRQFEINRLKEQVKKLQSEIKRLQELVTEQNRQIEELKRRYYLVRGLHIIEKQRRKNITIGALVFQYAFKEYIDMLVIKSSGRSLSEIELIFFKSFVIVLESKKQLSQEEKIAMKDFILKKYNYAIKHMQELNPEEMTNNLEAA